MHGQQKIQSGKQKLRLLIAVLMGIFMIFSGLSVMAATIKQMRGNRVLLVFDNDAGSPGDYYIAVNPSNGLRLGIIRLTTVRGNRAIGLVVKGRAEVGWMANAYHAHANSENSGNSESSGSNEVVAAPGSGNHKLAIGGLLGYAMESQSADLSGTTPMTANMTGSGFSGYGFGDYKFTSSFGVRIVAGMDQFAVKSGQNCSGFQCDTNITYLTGGGLLQWDISPGSFNPWLGAGVDLLMPMSHDSTAIQSSTIGLTYGFIAALGANISISHSMFLPVQLEYNYFLPSPGVSTNWIAVRVGLGFYF